MDCKEVSSIGTLIELSFDYDFDAALQRLSLDPVNAVNLPKREIRIPMDEGNIVTLTGIGTKSSPAFIMTDCVNDEQLEWVKNCFHFHQSLADVTAHFAGSDLSSLFVKYAGTPLIRNFSPYGTLMRNIIHQQLNVAFAHILTLRFVETYGTRQEGVWRYPQPTVIAALQVEDLQNLQFSRRKAEYVIGISKGIAERTLDLTKFEWMEDEDVVSKLTKLRGVGPWTAQNFLMFGLGRPNVFPLGDVGLQNALKKLWNMDRKPTADEMLSRFPHWSPYLSYAALYLWRSIE